MIIALDFDHTYTADPNLWRAFILNAQFRGHTVYIVTMRHEELDWNNEFEFLKDEYDVETIFCDGVAKRDVTLNRGILVDIWIDDHPQFISQGFVKDEASINGLNAWRKEQIANGGIHVKEKEAN